MRVIPIIKAETLIPKGMYCYTPVEAPNANNAFHFVVRSCPFWERYDEAKHGKLPPDAGSLSEDGGPGAYCRHLKEGDWMENGTMLLWDQVKECGINDDYDEDEVA